MTNQTKISKTSLIIIGLLFALVCVGPVVLFNLMEETDSSRTVIFSVVIGWSVSLLVLVYMVRRKLIRKVSSFSDKLNKNNGSKTLMGLIIFIFTSFSAIGTYLILNFTENGVFKALALNLILVWLALFLCYFIWAVYFYNFNYGLSNSEWKLIDEAKRNRASGKPYSVELIDEEPKYNPHKDDTFGLPPGTVRGMIAFTLLIGAIALLIVSFDNTIHFSHDSFFFDQFEFFKTAFLMMIAFYFGSRSLKYLQTQGVTSLSTMRDAKPDNALKPVMPHAKPSQKLEKAQGPPSPTEGIAIIEVVASENSDSSDSESTSRKEKITITDPMA